MKRETTFFKFLRKTNTYLCVRGLTGLPTHAGGGGGGVLPSNRLMGMCRWTGSHFHDWIDYNEVAFSIELLEWGRIFSGFRR